MINKIKILKTIACLSLLFSYELAIADSNQPSSGYKAAITGTDSSQPLSGYRAASSQPQDALSESVWTSLAALPGAITSSYILGLFSPLKYVLKVGLVASHAVSLISNKRLGRQLMGEVNQIKTIVSEIQLEVSEILQLDEYTIKLMQQQETSDLYTKLLTSIETASLQAGINDIYALYTDFYQNNVLPIKAENSSDLFDFASQQCDDKKCSPIGSSAMMLLDGNLPGEGPQNINPSLPGLIAKYAETLENSGNWDDVQHNFTEYLNSSTLISDYIGIYISAMSQLSALSWQYYQALSMLYNMQALQLAFYYVNPKLFENDSGELLATFAHASGGVELLSKKTGKEGYDESLQNLTNYYVNQYLGGSQDSKTLAGIFGGKYYKNDDGQIKPFGNYIPSIFNTQTLNNFIYHKLNGSNLFSAASNNIFPKAGSNLFGFYDEPTNVDGIPVDSFLNNCQIMSAEFPINKTDQMQISPIKVICEIQVNGQVYTTSPILLSVPYKYDSSGQISFGFGNIDLRSSDGYYYLSPVNGSKSYTSFYNPHSDLNQKAYIDTSTPNSHYGPTNPAFVYDCKGGSEGGCHIQFSPLVFEFENINLFQESITAASDTARLSCVNNNQKNYNEEICFTEVLGLNGKLAYSAQDVYSHSHEAESGSSAIYALSKSGYMFMIQISFPSAKGRNEVNGYKKDVSSTEQGVLIGCINGDSSCTTVVDYNPPMLSGYLNYAGGKGKIDIVSKSMSLFTPEGWVISDPNDGVFTFDYLIREPSPLPIYIFTLNSEFKTWLEKGNQSDGTMNETISSTYGLDLNFYNTNELDAQEQVILVSDNKQYRLIYTGLRNSEKINEGENYTLVTQKLGTDGKTWVDIYNALPYDELNGSLKSTEIARFSFKNGDLVTYSYDANPQSATDDSKFQVINSISQEYQTHGYQWVPDPYAKLVLQDNDGNLVIHSSNASTVSGSQLGLGSKQLLWAANWLDHVKKHDDVWDKINNPKLPTS